MSDKIRTVKGEETFIGLEKVIDQHLTNKILEGDLIKKQRYRLVVDSDADDLVLDLNKDLYLNKELICIVSIEGYSNDRSNEFVRRFEKGTTTVDFYLTCAVDKVPIINRPKMNGLGIQFNKY